MNSSGPQSRKAMRSQIGFHHGLHVFLRWIESGFDLLFPTFCAGCGQGNSIWCATCDRGLKRLRAPLCRGCGRALRGSTLCPACSRQPLPLNARSYARYQAALAKALIALKYRPNRRLAGVMGSWLEESYRQAGWSASLVMAVPLSRERRSRRGYNQAELLAAELARRLGLPLNRQALERIRDTRSQVGLLPGERWQNVHGAFRALGDGLAGQTVVVVDDLFTTGATLSACAHALHAAGVERVYGLTVAKA